MPDQRIFWIHAVALLAAFGCTGNSGLVPVSGKVTYKNEPVSGATIVFMGDENTRPATAISGPDGSYSLMTLDASGAMPGKYSVVVSKTETPDMGEPLSMEEAAKPENRIPPGIKQLLPAKYGDAIRTPLKYEVKPGPAATFDIQLTD